MRKLLGITAIVAALALPALAYAKDMLTVDEVKTFSADRMRDPKVSDAARMAAAAAYAEAFSAAVDAGRQEAVEEFTHPRREPVLARYSTVHTKIVLEGETPHLPGMFDQPACKSTTSSGC